jgi:phospholipid/cholesterol/gamma-HCH transport system substrate-binding protein
MRRYRRDQGTLNNPVLIGALTVLVTIVAVTLAYQANNGLPFVPRYNLHVQIADAAELTHGAEVHMGGALVGSVDTVTPGRDSAGQPIAVLNLKLNKNVEPLPVNSSFDVRLKGAIGLKYLQVTPGNSTRTWPDGATVPLGHATAEVDFDQVLGMFNEPTRVGIQQSTIGFSNALAGRGPDLNNAIGAFVPLLNDLLPVAKNLSSRNTDLGGFFRGLESFSSAVVPVAQTQADLYVNLDTTFKSLASVAPSLQQWISTTPPAFSAVINDAPTIDPFLLDTAALFHDLRPGFATLPQSAPVLANAFAVGTKNLPGTSQLDARLLSLAKTFEAYSNNDTVTAGLNRLTLTLSSLTPPLRFLTPTQTTCNYVTLFLRNIGSLLSDPISTGTTLRFVIVAIDQVVGGEAVPSQTVYTKPQTSILQEHGPLHSNFYPNTAAPGQSPIECAAGNEPYSGTAASIGNPPGNLGTHTQKTTRSGT